jgi:hypothetical protein
LAFKADVPQDEQAIDIAFLFNFMIELIASDNYVDTPRISRPSFVSLLKSWQVPSLVRFCPCKESGIVKQFLWGKMVANDFHRPF